MLAPCRSADIKRIFVRGKKIDTPYFRLWRLDKKDRGFRAVVICSRKVDKRATRRNLLKRRMREIFRRDVHPRLPTSDIIVECKPSMKNIPFATLKKELLCVLHL
ncbi:MAG: ribonuclease P protein component [Candidatus Ryanbacteria bacterium]|nr:ribonuclease P protein component [Candidatus Ryanbacteria bacterium]